MAAKNLYAWRKWKKGFPFKGLNDPKYIKVRNKTFKKNGNGWWIKEVKEENNVTDRRCAK